MANWQSEAPTSKQLNFLKQLGYKGQTPLSKGEACELIYGYMKDRPKRVRPPGPAGAIRWGNVGEHGLCTCCREGCPECDTLSIQDRDEARSHIYYDD